jgi:hypothetical protein
MISVSDHNAKGDGKTDDAASIQAAIHAAGGNDTVYFPGGTYLVGSTLELTGGTRLLGGSRATKLLAAMAGDLIQVSGTKSAISHLGFSSAIAGRTGAYVRNWKDPDKKEFGANLIISECYFEGGFDHVVGDFAQDLYLVDCSLQGFSHYGVVLGLYGSGHQNSQPGNSYISRCELAAGGALAGIYVKQSGGLYISQVDIYGANTTRDGINLDPSPSLGSIDWTFLDQVQCDSCAHDGLAANGAGVVNGLFCSNSWFSSNGNVGVELGFSNTVSGAQLSGCQVVNNRQGGINLQFHAKQVTITGCLVSGNGGGIGFAPGVEDVVITGSVVGPMSGFPNSQKFGISFNGPVTRCLVSSNSLSNNVGGSSNGPPPGVTWVNNV